MPTLDEKVAADKAAQLAAIEAAKTETVDRRQQIAEQFENQPNTIDGVPVDASGQPVQAQTTEPAQTTTETTEPPQDTSKPSETEAQKAERFKRERVARKAAEKRAADAEAKLAAIEAGDANQLNDEVITRKAKELAQRKAQEDRNAEFNRQCDEIAIAGKAIPDFMDAVEELNDTLGGFVNAAPIYDAAYEFGATEAAKMVHYLGENPEEAVKLSKMTYAKQGAAIFKLHAKLNPPVVVPVKQVSKAAPPVNPVGGNSVAAPEADMMKMSFDEFMAQQNKRKWASMGR